MAGLHTELVGEGRPRLAFLHGLFGRGRNWTGIASALADEGFPGVLFDLPNHGSSPWTDEFSYQAMADAVADELELRLGSAARLAVVGHSLGGKVAMLLALSRPDLVESLAVVDISPATSTGVDEFGPLVAALQSVDLTRVTSRAQVEAELATRIRSTTTRQFLMQNLRARPKWHWQPNLDLLGASLDAIAAWPDPGPVSYPGPVVWLVGEESEYVQPEHLETMRRLFPAVEVRPVAGAGHWVHADNPDAVVAELRRLLDVS